MDHSRRHQRYNFFKLLIYSPKLVLIVFFHFHQQQVYHATLSKTHSKKRVDFHP